MYYGNNGNAINDLLLSLIHTHNFLSPSFVSRIRTDLKIYKYFENILASQYPLFIFAIWPGHQNEDVYERIYHGIQDLQEKNIPTTACSELLHLSWAPVK